VSDTAETTAAPEGQITPADLLDNLRELGSALPVSSLPTPSDAAPILSGIVYYLATGSLVAPVVERPNETEQRAADAEQSRIAELESQVETLRRQGEAGSVSASPVAPPPVAPVEPAAATPAEPVAPAEPAAPAEPVAPAPVDPTVATPTTPPVPAEGTTGS
jgi:hypothetical protein